MAYTYNVMAETTSGNPNRTIVVGSHLDSVPAGPGLNDNGSGSSMNLELAIQFSRLITNPVNRVRFMWWGAEEIGLLGSYEYVANLTSAERNNTLCALNFDMMASPNGVREVYNGSLVPSGTTADVIAKSNVITDLFVQHFNRANLPFVNAAMGGGSDYFPFIVDNIPAGALATGASQLKSIAQRTTYGGLANAALDPCYHLSCDTPANIDQTLLQQMANAAADVIGHLATTEDPLSPASRALHLLALADD